ncbi:MAG: site-2 protease family protein [Erysipelothrix sp.]|nr:site-2 protease family protein [Erysipelothrix sp.]
MEMFRGLISFVLVLGVVVAVHEFGHLLAAKFFNVYCAEYAIGMGPLLFQVKGKETKYSLRLLPVGGYVAMAGESEQESSLFPDDLDPKRTITGINPWKRIVVQLAGIFMNLVLGVIVFTLVFFMSGSPFETSSKVVNIMENSPAESSGFEVGDIVTTMTVDSRVIEVNEFSDMALEEEDVSKERQYTVLRDGVEKEITVTPEWNEENNQYLVGVSFGAKSINIFESIVVGLRYTVSASLLIFSVLKDLFAGIGLENLSGPVGIYTATSQVAAQGLVSLVFFTGILSVNVGILQLLPLPALDGGRVVFSLWEAITGRPVNKKLETTLILVSFLLLFALIIFVTYKDILNLF